MSDIFDNSLNLRCNYKPDPIPRLQNIYNYKDAEKFKPQTYDYYSEIKGGNVEYHPYRRTVIDNFKNPNFVNYSFIKSNVYTDPMGSIKPQYERIETKNRVVVDQLTWMMDSNEWREQLMARQMRKQNETQYDPKLNFN
ncbi:MAG: hypothetical protein EBU90_19470 [Proteobacteria bacterium]|nr:hypothetical protein [Pseudomonadota bacterium]NBP15692.1 hypothetical protein [bacterium]